MSTDTFEKIKIELRSILLSSKHGVAVTDIQNDYELLSCQRLPYRELGFNDVQSLMRAMPDVAKEVKSPNGQVVYHAVCDESTAHIHKLVSNQTTKKKKIKYPTVRGRGRGGFTRGSRGFNRSGGRFVSGREPHRSSYTGNSSVGDMRSTFSHAAKGGRFFPASSRVVDGSGDNENESGSRGFRDYLNKNKSVFRTDQNTDPSRISRAIVGRGATKQHSLSSDGDSDDHREISSRTYNLKIGVSQTGQRVISTYGSPVGLNRDAGNHDDDISSTNSSYDLRQYINKKREQQTGADNNDEVEGAVGGRSFNSDSQRNKRVMKENNLNYPRNLPPRLQRKQQSGLATQERPALLPNPNPVMPQSHFSDVNTIYTIEKNNWVPPEDGPLYLQTYYNYFVQRGEEAPNIEIIHGKLKNRRGYYGQLMWNDKHYFPLEIMQNLEQAQQNVARLFCLTNEIPLLATEQHKSNVQQNHTTPQVQQQVHNVVASNSTASNPEVKLPQVSHHPQPSVAPHKQSSSLQETLEKVYKILTPNGIWVSRIAELYQTSYNETMNVDLLSVASQWPEYFTLEELAPNRYTVYPVRDALTKKQVVDITHEVKSSTDTSIFVPVPSTLLPSVGSTVQVLFSFAYSAVDMYVQKSDMENLVYEIDEILNKNCPATSPPEVDAVALSSLMAANYQGGWYRAQVVSVEKTLVSVYFIDYGNREQVSVTDLRPIPHEELTLGTPSLAIRCSLRKSKAGEWCQNITNILTDLSENNPVLSAVILEYEGEQCIVELYTPEGSLINDMLIESAHTPQRQHAVEPTPVSVQQQDQQKSKSPGIATKLFADDPEPLVIPDRDSFVVYVCRIMSENTVLLRIVDYEYSDKLDELEKGICDNFYSWPMPKDLKHSNIYAGMVLADADDVVYDEEGKEKLSDENKFYRVRVLRENQDGSVDCYLPDHGHDELLNRSQLREIDPHLNLSLSYQAVMAKLHGLDNISDSVKHMAVHLLINILTNGSTYHAIRRGKSTEKTTVDYVEGDAVIVNRVRKIISCMRDVQPANVAKIYQSVYTEPLHNVEEVIKNIPGYGYWRESLEVELIDTNQDDDDVNINEYVLAEIEEIKKVQSQGGNVEEYLQNLLSSADTSQAGTDNESIQEGSDSWAGMANLQDASKKLETSENNIEDQAKLSHVNNYVQNLASSTLQDDNVKGESGKVLYTWSTKSEIENDAISSCHTPSISPPSTPPSTICDTSNLPKFWTYPMLQFVSLQIVRVENPSFFVVIPMEQREALEKLEIAIAQYFSANNSDPATSLSDVVVYAVKSKDVFRRALYVNPLGDVVKVFLPDHQLYDTVHPSELFLLPQQFYSLPFLANKSRLGGVVPNGQDWSMQVTQWFKDAVNNKCLYAFVTGEEHSSSSDPRIPGTLVVRLIDTSGSEDVLIEEFMESQGMALRDPTCD